MDAAAAAVSPSRLPPFSWHKLRHFRSTSRNLQIRFLSLFGRRYSRLPSKLPKPSSSRSLVRDEMVLVVVVRLDFENFDFDVGQ